MFGLFSQNKEADQEIKNLFEYLIKITPSQTTSDNYSSQYKKLIGKSKRNGHKVFLKLYFTWEDYLLNRRAAFGEPTTKEILRHEISEKININNLDEEMRVIFMETRDQLVHLYESLVHKLGKYISSNISFSEFEDIVAEIGKDTVFENVLLSKKGLDFTHFNSIIHTNPAEYPASQITKIFRSFVSSLYDKIELNLGEKTIQSIFQKLYTDIKETYSTEFATIFLNITPEKILGLDQWLSLLTKSELEKQVKEKTKELEYLNASLEERVDLRTKELQAAYEELKELDKQKTDFISVAAHQIRTPLSGIKWIVDMLLSNDEKNLTEDQIGFLKKAEEANEKLLLIVNDMLNTDLASTGQAAYDFKKINIMEVLNSTIEEATPQANTRNIKLVWNNKIGSECIIEADMKKIKSVIQNLLDNAIKYSKPGTEVITESEKDFDHIILRIIDSGIGIPEDQKNDIFKRFFRATNSVRTHANGSGLGLFIARSVVEAHHGSIKFDSIENKGTTFTIVLPLIQNKISA